MTSSKLRLVMQAMVRETSPSDEERSARAEFVRLQALCDFGFVHVCPKGWVGDVLEVRLRAPYQVDRNASTSRLSRAGA